MEVKFEDVSYKIDNKYILEKLRVKLSANKINSILGLNGSGKTTIYKILKGEITDFNGTILIDGKDLTSFNLNHDVAFLDDVIHEKLVKDYLENNLKRYEYKMDILSKHILDSLKMVGLDKSYLEYKFENLSSGELVLVKIASLLSLNPKLLVIDNPTINLDIKDIQRLIKIVRILKNRFHKTIIFLSNDVEFVHKISDTIYFIDNGKLVKYGNKYDIFTDFKMLEKYDISIPNSILFSKKVLEKKNIKIGYRDDINDLLKDIYRYK